MFNMILIVGIKMESQALNNLGQIIREKREALGLTQIEVAEKAGLDRNYIGMVERGERNPSYLSLIKIASGLNMSVDQLIKPENLCCTMTPFQKSVLTSIQELNHCCPEKFLP